MQCTVVNSRALLLGSTDCFGTQSGSICCGEKRTGLSAATLMDQYHFVKTKSTSIAEWGGSRSYRTDHKTEINDEFTASVTQPGRACLNRARNHAGKVEGDWMAAVVPRAIFNSTFAVDAVRSHCLYFSAFVHSTEGDTNGQSVSVWAEARVEVGVSKHIQELQCSMTSLKGWQSVFIIVRF